MMAGIALLGGLAGLALTGDATVGISVTGKQTGFRAQASLMRRNTGVQVSIAITVAGMFALGVYGSYLPVYLDSLEMSAVMISLLSRCYQFWWGWVEALRSPCRWWFWQRV